MTYKSIITTLDPTSSVEHSLTAAAAVARRFGGHLSVRAVAFEASIPIAASGHVSAEVVVTLNAHAKEQAARLADAAERRLQTEGCLYDVAELLCVSELLEARFGALARFYDLAVLCAPTESLLEGPAPRLAEGPLFVGGAPLLLMNSRRPAPRAARVVIAWNDSQEALRAVRAALPYLAEAEQVSVISFDPGETEQHSSNDLARMLTRHGAAVDVLSVPLAGASVADALRRIVAEIGADLVVMGAYGHSRLREFVFGGVTREVLATPPDAALMMSR